MTSILKGSYTLCLSEASSDQVGSLPGLLVKGRDIPNQCTTLDETFYESTTKYFGLPRPPWLVHTWLEPARDACGDVRERSGADPRPLSSLSRSTSLLRSLPCHLQRARYIEKIVYLEELARKSLSEPSTN